MPGKVATREEWLVARKELLAKEKAATEIRDSLAALRSELPMVKLDTEYTFTGPNGKVTLPDMFEGRKQLTTYHFMFSPDDEAGCFGCSFLVDNLPSTVSHLHHKNTTLAIISPAPYEKIEKFKKRMGWTFPWYSSFGTDFTYYSQHNVDGDVPPPGSNRKPGEPIPGGVLPAISVFYKEEDAVYHTYTTASRSVESLIGTIGLLDMTPLGRQDKVHPMEYKLHDEY